MSWLLEARKRHELSILNYAATSNHIHLLVLDRGESEAISRSMQLVASRTAQAFNQRKKRKGAFWEDRYHATAVETNHHIVSCIIYIDLNMVRAGVVAHPSEWEFGGYAEIQTGQEEDSIIDRRALMELLRIPSIEAMRRLHKEWVEEALARGGLVREGMWTESVAVGSRHFVETIRTKLRLRAKGRKITGMKGEFTLCEPQGFFGDDLDA